MNLVNVLADYCSGSIGSGITIPEAIGNLINLGFKLLQIAVPILLIFWGMLDFAKAVIGQNDEDIKKKQGVFIKRLIAAVVVFLIVTIVQLVIGIVSNIGGDTNEAGNAWTCAHDLITGTH
jgi:hypothetical protein